DAGVPVETVEWYVSYEADPDAERLGLVLPPYVQRSRANPLVLLLRCEVDAVILGETPPEVREAKGRLRRLCANFAELERDYFIRTGVFPGHHVLGIRREVVDQDPEVPRQVYDAFS